MTLLQKQEILFTSEQVVTVTSLDKLRHRELIAAPNPRCRALGFLAPHERGCPVIAV